MDCRIEAKTRAFVEELAREHQQELAAAGTIVDLEELTCQIGDSITRLLTEQELRRRGQEGFSQPAECPDCGRHCLPMPDPEPVVLTGLRGPVAYQQPRYFCDRCRRSFFPSRGPLGAAAAKYGDHQGAAKDCVGRREQSQLSAGR